MSARSATVRAIGPLTDRLWTHPVWRGHTATRPGDGRRPTTLQKLAGLRSDPPMSVPSAIGTMPEARATAAPPLLPPQVRPRSYGFRVVPKTSLKVCEPAPNSGVLVLPIVIAPAVRSRSTIRASASGTFVAKTVEPNVVRMPRVSTRSLWATGSPWRHPISSPRANAASASPASPAAARAVSATKVTMALSAGFTRSMLARCASITSMAEISRSRSSRTRSTAVKWQSSLVSVTLLPRA